MISTKQWRTFNIAALILGVVMVAAAYSVLIAFQHTLGTQNSVEKLCSVLAVVGGSMIGISLRRLTRIKAAIDEAAGWNVAREKDERGKRIRENADRMAEICFFPLILIASLAYILFIEPIWGLPLVLAVAGVLQFILYRCLIVWYRRKSKEADDRAYSDRPGG